MLLLGVNELWYKTYCRLIIFRKWTCLVAQFMIFFFLSFVFIIILRYFEVNAEINTVSQRQGKYWRYSYKRMKKKWKCLQCFKYRVRCYTITQMTKGCTMSNKYDVNECVYVWWYGDNFDLLFRSYNVIKYHCII